jgi:hypothetical protein
MGIYLDVFESQNTNFWKIFEVFDGFDVCDFKYGLKTLP